MKRHLVRLTILLLAVFLVACNNDEEEKQVENTIVPVETVEAKEGELVIDRTINGRTAPKSVTPIMIEQPGEIDALEVKNGDKVNEDDLIATILTSTGKQHIYAKETGEIANLEVKPGDIASNEEPLAVIIDLEEISVTLSVTSDVRALFKKEDQREAIINEETYEAEVTEISTLPNDTGLYDVEATIKNENTDILPGIIAKIIVPEKRIKKTIILPTEAIIEEIEGTYIYIIKDNEAVKTEITVKETQSTKTAVKGEVSEGDEVVINGQLTLSDGSEVEVVEEENKS